MIAVSPQTEKYCAEFERVENSFAGPNWLKAIRRAGIDRFVADGFPTTRWEEWRFTPISPIAETSFRPARHSVPDAGMANSKSTACGDPAADCLTFVNGHYAPEMSRLCGLPAGVRAISLADGLKGAAVVIEQHLAHYAKLDKSPFVALNSAFFVDGALVHIPRGVIVESPIYLRFISTASGEAAISSPRILIVAEENSQATIVECYTANNGGVYLTNAVTEIVLEQNAVVDHYKVNRESPDGYHIATIQIHQDRSSSFSNHAITLGGAISRNDINTRLDGEGAEATLNGLFLGTGKQLIDSHTRIDHAAPHCPSHELYKGILDDKAHGVFNGKIYVHPDAQKTDAKQTNQNLLLSRDATIDTKPQLEIFADDVRCTHGCTIGQLQDDAIFYLRTRGISVEAARGLLTYAFASDIIDRIRIPSLRESLAEALFELEAPLLEQSGYLPT